MKDLFYCVGADIGGTSIKMGLYEKGEDKDGLVCKWEISTDISDNGNRILGDISDSLNRVCADKNISYDKIAGIGIGVPGPVGPDGVVHECVNLGWKSVDVCSEFKKISKIPLVIAGNDANVSALGEMWKGGGRGFDNLIMITLGTGVGGGVIIDGKILSGSIGAAGEIGHITVNPEETRQCNCKSRGCLEQYSSATGIVNIARSIMSIPEKEDISAKTVLDMAKAGDKSADKAVDTAMKYLGMALSNVACVTDPQVFVIGGGVSAAGKFLLDRIEKYYNIYSMNTLKNKEFRIAELGNDAGFYGCIKMVIDNV